MLSLMLLLLMLCLLILQPLTDDDDIIIFKGSAAEMCDSAEVRCDRWQQHELEAVKKYLENQERTGQVRYQEAEDQDNNEL